MVIFGLFNKYLSKTTSKFSKFISNLLVSIHYSVCKSNIVSKWHGFFWNFEKWFISLLYVQNAPQQKFTHLLVNGAKGAGQIFLGIVFFFLSFDRFWNKNLNVLIWMFIFLDKPILRSTIRMSSVLYQVFQTVSQPLCLSWATPVIVGNMVKHYVNVVKCVSQELSTNEKQWDKVGYLLNQPFVFVLLMTSNISLFFHPFAY